MADAAVIGGEQRVVEQGRALCVRSVAEAQQRFRFAGELDLPDR